ncbi:MAG TPA: T9SS type A sorting domain-containing protein [Flavipsychrobacter sp.]|mgnify:CR=1 FL=1|jgi:uncharacterized delta-60 repeat protein|nr:T9SS type A sorting domain-containing protein [Flavipsychrobacter sp.]
MKRLLFILLFCIFGNFFSYAQPLIGLDPTFANNGIYTGDTGAIYQMRIQPDKKIISVGINVQNWTYNNVITRFNENGSPDNNFANSGLFLVSANSSSTPHKSVSCIGLQSDGKIVLGGASASTITANTNLLLMRLNANGTIDSGFGVNGETIIGLAGDEYINSIALQSDGKVVAYGEGQWFGSPALIVARFESSGNIDSSFGVDGIVWGELSNWGIQYPSPNDIAVMQDGRIVLGTMAKINSINSYAFTAIRLLSDGKLDTSYNHTGIAYTYYQLPGLAYCKGMCLYADGKILLAGYADSIAIAKFDTLGQLDTTFGRNGVQKINIGNDIAISLQQDGKIMLSGNIDTGTILYRQLLDGNIDSSFGINGQIATYNFRINTIISQADGKIVVGGGLGDINAKNMIARFNPNAMSVFTSPLASQISLYPNPATNVIYIDNKNHQKIEHLHLYNIDGKLLRIQTYPNTERLNTEGITNGIYYLHIGFAYPPIVIKKVVIQKN